VLAQNAFSDSVERNFSRIGSNLDLVQSQDSFLIKDKDGFVVLEPFVKELSYCSLF
jgi:hypothetical protein